MSTRFSLTTEQEAAVSNRGGSLLVSAAAGAGKTMVLVERLMRYLTDPNNAADITDFLVITYTRAAAAELRSKILNEVSSRIAEHPDDRHLRRQASLCLKASISTIHSFCTDMIRENAHVLDLPQDIRVIDGEEAGLIKSEVLDRVLESRYCDLENDKEFHELVDCMAESRGDENLRNALLDAYASLRSHPDPEAWIQEQLNAFALDGVEDISCTVWGSELIDWSSRIIEHVRDSMKNGYEKLTADPKALAAYGESFRIMIDSYNSFLSALGRGWDVAASCSDFPFPAVKPLSGYDEIKSIRNNARAAAKRVTDIFSASSGQLVGDMQAAYPSVSAFLKLLLEFDEAYAEEKKRRGVLDYSDQEHFCLRLFYDYDANGSTELARSVARRFREILVDEYQDINAVQELIFSSISDEGKNLFMVGDVKQSIYRFRLADPTIFIRKYSDFKPASEAEAGEPRKIVLPMNFRSKSGILDAVNYVFTNLMSRQLGEMDYTPDEYLYAGRSDDYSEESAVELDVLDTTESDPSVRISPEADFVADRIISLISGEMQIPDGNGGTRPVEPSDICILLRSMKGRASAYAAAVMKRGIPVALSDTTSFFDTLEVSVLISLLSVIDNPMQDIPLFSVLRSPLFGFEPDELAAIRAEGRDVSFYNALCERAEKSEKCAEFIRQLTDFRKRSLEMSAEDLIFYILDKTSFFAIIGAMEGGRIRQSNIMLLAQYAHEYEKNGYRGLFGFMTYIRALIDQDKEPGTVDARTASSGVSIMSIHKSKGLEFPVIILADTAKQFNLSDSSKPVLFHHALGVGFRRRDLKKRIQYPTIARDAVSRRINLDSLSEELRVMYVAMTRAREKLIITASLNKAEDHIRKLLAETSAPVSPGVLESKKCFADWLLLAALTRPESNVFGLCPATAHDIELGTRWDMNLYILDENGFMPYTGIDAEPDSITCESDLEEAHLEICDKDLKELVARIKWRYPHQGAETIPAKLTATELKGRMIDREIHEEAALSMPKIHTEDYRRPEFITGADNLTATEKGTALHTVMQYADFNRCTDIDSIKAEINRLAAGGYLNERQASSIAPEKVLGFVRSSIGMRALSAEKLNREFKFSVLLPASRFMNWDGDEEILFQGAIDCWFEDEDGITIVDFKTDRINEDNFSDRIKAYTPQLLSYAAALHAITGKRIARCVIYFFANGRAVSVGNDYQQKFI